MKTIASKYDKEQIADLPRVVFPGRTEVIVSERSAERAVKFLMKQPLLGFDTETKPSFKKGLQYKVSLLQVCLSRQVAQRQTDKEDWPLMA